MALRTLYVLSAKRQLYTQPVESSSEKRNRILQCGMLEVTLFLFSRSPFSSHSLKLSLASSLFYEAA